LHAKTLGFTHPKTKKFVSFESEIPDDMKEIVEKWKIYLEGIAK
jgi:23S rRNA pseudouridine1911/1915/1917 synthase